MDTLFGKHLRDLRGEMSQAAFAKQLGASSSAVGQYERGDQLPGAAFLMAISERYNVSLDWLLTGKEPIHHDPESGKDAHPHSAAGADTTPTAPCFRCATLETELYKEREMSRELVTENRKLWKENSECRVELEKAKARAAPGNTQPEAPRRAG